MIAPVLHSQQPQTLAHALADSPSGLLGWHDQLLGDTLECDFVLSNTAIYWLTNTAGSAIRFYYENANGPRATEPTRIPLGLCAAGEGDFKSIRRFAERDHRAIVSWHVYPEIRSHYAAHHAPDIVVADLREFYRPLGGAALGADSTASTGATA